MTFDHQSYFRHAIETLQDEGNYRTFAEIQRNRGAFPAADFWRNGVTSDVTVWCSNDYLGMGPASKCP